MRHVVLAVVGVGALLAGVACGGSGDSGGGQTPTSPSPSGSGTVTMTSTAITNQSGRILVVTATAEGQGPLIGRACIRIDSNAFIVAPTTLVEIAASGEPCDPASVTKTFAAGRLLLTMGIFVPGAQTPEQATTQSVQVAGNVSVSINGAALSR